MMLFEDKPRDFLFWGLVTLAFCIYNCRAAMGAS